MTKPDNYAAGKVAAKTTLAGILAGLAFVSGAAGCSAEVGQAPEDVVATTSELGEVRCAEQACTEHNSCQTIFAPNRHCGIATTEAFDSPPYGTFGCPQAATVVITASGGTRIHPFIEWGDVPLTADTCASGKLDLTVHTRASSSDAWTSTIHRYHGEWQLGPFGAASCQFSLNDGYSDPADIIMTSTTEITLAGSAKVGSSGYRTVGLGASSGTGPC